MQWNKRYALSMSSWFCIPEEGMKDFEILSRASAFLVRNPTPTEKFQHDYHVITASHVVAPWRWPKYYPQPWLQCVNEKHTHYTMELRHPNGLFQTISDLVPITFHHPTRDIAVLHMMSSDANMADLTQLGLQVLELATKQEIDEFSNQIEFHGHEISGEASEEQDVRVPIPRIVTGTYFSRSKYQTFAKTSSVLVDGMCGGPLILPKSTTHVNIDNSSVNKTPRPQSDSAYSAKFVTRKKINNLSSDISNTTTNQSETSSNASVTSSSPSGDYKNNNDGSRLSQVSTVKCGGVLEGIVPLSHPDEQLRGLACYFESYELASFLRDIEQLKATPLIGGESLKTVSQDKDPKKMDITEIAKKFGL